MLYDEIKVKLKEYRDDPKQFIERFLHIETTPGRIQSLLHRDIKAIRGKIYPFYFSEEQKILYNIFIKQRQQRKPVRIIYLKSRQTCSTTFWAGLSFANAILEPNTKAIIIANQEDIAQIIYDKIDLFYKDLPPELKPEITQFSRLKGIKFDNKLGTGLKSEINTAVSANKDAAAGTSKTWFLGSEVARWFFPEEIMLSVDQTLPEEPHTVKVLETTARGYGNWFHQEWLRAKEKLTNLEPVFIPWFKHDYYRKYPDERFFDIPLNQEKRYGDESALKQNFNLTNDQLYWRRQTIDNKCQGDPLKFCQEYPSTDIEAFINTNLAVFNIRKLQELLYQCSPGKEGEIKNGFFHEVVGGQWTLWERVQPGVVYIFGIDSGTGVEGGDPNATIVLRADNLHQIAELHNHTDAKIYAQQIIEGAKYFNNAFLVPELTGSSGGALLERLKDKYYNIYRWERIDEFGKVITSKLGFETNLHTKGLVVEDIREYINFDLGKINSVELIRELMSYVELPNGKLSAIAGCKDDRVIAFGIALRGYRSRQRRWETPLKSKPEPILTAEYKPENNVLLVPSRRYMHSSAKQYAYTDYGII
ncbi:MAG: hypothetical protein AB1567_04550 [bacterium]